jgi:cholinesterase
MRAANSSTILKALGSQSFTPTIDNTIVFADYTTRSRTGNLIHKPILIGNNDNEGTLFEVQYLKENKSFPAPVAQYNLQHWTCPSAVRANASLANGIPTWRYRWFGVYPNTNLTTSSDSGAYHGSEVPIVFNTTPSVGVNTKLEIQVIDYVQSAWAAFAKDPVNGLAGAGLGWKTYDPAAATLLRLGWQNDSAVNYTIPQVYDKECAAMGFSFPLNGTGEGKIGGNTTSNAPGQAYGVANGFRLSVVMGVVMVAAILILM